MDDDEQIAMDLTQTELVEAEDRLSVWAKNQSELAKVLGCDRKSIQRWLKDGDAECPGKTSDGRYNVTLWRLWTEKKGKKPANRLGRDKGSLELENIQLRNDKLEIENTLRRGELMHVDEVCQVLTEMMGAFTMRMRGIKHTLGPQVIGVPVSEATKRIGREVDENLTELSLGAWAKKKPFWGIVYAKLAALHKSYSPGDGPSDTSLCQSVPQASDGVLRTPGLSAS